MFNKCFPRQRQYSISSENALMHLSTLSKALRRMERQVYKIEEQFEMKLEKDELLVFKTTIAQLVGMLDKLQFNGIDSVITAQLQSGKEKAREKRKTLNQRCEKLRQKILTVHEDIQLLLAAF